MSGREAAAAMAVPAAGPSRHRSRRSQDTLAKGRKRRPPAQASLRIRSQRLAAHLNAAAERAFRHHGRALSLHPIQTLLLACLLITSLFYPAAGIYLWASKGGPGLAKGDAKSVWRSLSTPFLDSFASSGRKHHNSIRDLRMIWDDAKDLVALDVRDWQDGHGTDGSWSAASVISPYGVPATYVTPGSAMTKSKEPPKCRSVRLEHVFITTDDVLVGQGPRYGVLDTPIVKSALQLQTAIERILTAPGSSDAAEPRPDVFDPPRCVRAKAGGPCLTLGPADYWREQDPHNASSLDPYARPPHVHLLDQHESLNLSSRGIPMSLQTTLAGRSHLFTKLPRADHMAFTFFLEEPEGYGCSPSSMGREEANLSRAHGAFVRMLKQLTGAERGAVNIIGSEHTQPKELLLQFNPDAVLSRRTTRRTLLAIGYVLLGLYLSRGLTKVKKVHSRFGLAFTGAIELLISLIVSASICALAGIRLNSVPWEILPFVIVVVGSENMFALINAVVATPLSLTVPARMAAGLGKIGVPIAITVVSDLALLSTIMVLVDVRAVKEFCLFAICTLAVDFVMQMTLFATVLSIDMQRLELADLLSQGGRTGSNAPNQPDIPRTPSSESSDKAELKKKPGSTPSAIRTRLWKARTARTVSLALLVAFLLGLYVTYGTGYPHGPASYYNEEDLERLMAPVNETSKLVKEIVEASLAVGDAAFDPFAHLQSPDSAVEMPWWLQSPSAAFWTRLNPRGAPYVRVIVEPWTIISLRSSEQEIRRQSKHLPFASWALFRPRVRAIIWFAKLVVLPIAGTTCLLWILLLYLLKDTELLDAQRDKEDAMSQLGTPEDATDALPEDDLSVRVACNIDAHALDVELVAQSGGYVVSAGVDSSICAWKYGSRRGSPPVRRDVRALTPDDFSPVTALDVSASAGIVAVARASGQVNLLALSDLALFSQPGAAGAGPDSPAIGVYLRASEELALTSAASVALSVHRDGSAWLWRRQQPAECCLEGRAEAPWTSFPVGEASRDAHPSASDTLIGFSSSAASFGVYRHEPGATRLEPVVSLVLPQGTIIRSAAVSRLVCDDEEPVVTAATSAPQSDAERAAAPTETGTLLTGSATGQLQAWDIASGQLVASVDLLDGPITRLSLAPEQGDEHNSDLVIASTGAQVSVLRLENRNGRARAGLPASISASTTSTTQGRRTSVARSSLDESGPFSALGTNGSSPLAPPPKKHSSRPSTADGGSQGVSPELGRFLSATPGNSARIRRGSALRLNGTSDASSAFPLTLPEGMNGSALADPYQPLRLVTTVPCLRGGADLVELPDGSLALLGVRRRPIDADWIPALGGARPSLTASTGRWEAWQLPLSTLGSDQWSTYGPGYSAALRRADLELGSSSVHRGGAQASTATSTTPRSARFATPRPGLGALSFTRLRPVTSSRSSRRPALIFGFGNSVASLELREDEPLASTSTSAGVTSDALGMGRATKGSISSAMSSLGLASGPSPARRRLR